MAKAMKERGMLFSGLMVRANLDERKSQTRRVRGLDEINAEPEAWDKPFFNQQMGFWEFLHIGENAVVELRCPYGVPGDLFYMRERLLLQRESGTEYFDVLYDADSTHFDNGNELDDWFMNYGCWYDSGKSKRFIPSVHMPKYAARPERYEITDIRVERVRDISKEDAKAEGVHWLPRKTGYQHCFMDLWNKINLKRDYGWQMNPWVWVVCYRKLK